MNEQNTEYAPVLIAARQWVESILSHPNNWASLEDMTLIREVRTAFPDVKCPWLDDPLYAGWADLAKPAQIDGSAGLGGVQ